MTHEICYYHSDMDGIASAAIVKSVYPNCEFVKVNYGDKMLEGDYDKIFIVDFSFPKEVMEMLPKDKLCWIDHHQSAKDKVGELWDSDKIDGLRDTTKAACQLAWEWFYPHTEVHPIITFLADWDTWKFKFGDDTKAIHEICDLKYGTVETMEDLLFRQYIDTTTEKLMIQGKILYAAKLKRIEKNYEKRIGKSWNGLWTAFLNTSNDISDTASYALEQGFELAIVWQVVNGTVILSLRSKTIDVAKLAEKYGGGGHKAASSCSMDLDTFRREMGI